MIGKSTVSNARTGIVKNGEFSYSFLKVTKFSKF